MTNENKSIEKKEISLLDLQGEAYDTFIDEARSILSVHSFNANLSRVIGYWLLGDRIVKELADKSYGDGVIKKLSADIGIDQATLHKAIRFRNWYPEFLDKHGEPQVEQIELDGASVNWSQIKNNLLVEGKNCEHEKQKTVRRVSEVVVCRDCGRVISMKIIEQ